MSFPDDNNRMVAGVMEFRVRRFGPPDAKMNVELNLFALAGSPQYE